MAAAAKPDDRHAGGDRGGDADDAVLDHNAGRRGGAEPARPPAETGRGPACPPRPGSRCTHAGRKSAAARSAPDARAPAAGGRSRRRSAPPATSSAIPRPPASASARARGQAQSRSRIASKNPSGRTRPKRASTAAVRVSRFLPKPSSKASAAVAGNAASVRHSPSTRAKMISLSTRTPSQSKMTRSDTRSLSPRELRRRAVISGDPPPGKTMDAAVLASEPPPARRVRTGCRFRPAPGSANCRSGSDRSHRPK